ncbi:hypothetical protein SASPL_141011 [Salvia splendens]|uniref:Myb-like domain-containing protein n=1 Tax=Salvia splendens TaxID=180675 RepID=A0A8X8WS42_SALSN|nr:hypothetical protein SASPL_141011 [Salvia splendens]
MTKPDGLAPDTNDDVSPAAWGTWEELLLAFAVNHHGTASWDSISSELQKRTSNPNLCLSAHGCRSKYLDLKRRFVVTNGDFEAGKSNADESGPLLDELRKLRVAELRREVTISTSSTPLRFPHTRLNQLSLELDEEDGSEIFEGGFVQRELEQYRGARPGGEDRTSG